MLPSADGFMQTAQTSSPLHRFRHTPDFANVKRRPTYRFRANTWHSHVMEYLIRTFGVY
jgi:hypothetical protein